MIGTAIVTCLLTILIIIAILPLQIPQARLCRVGGHPRRPRQEQDQQRGAEEEGGGKVRQRLHH